jgi:hypothetical protein
MVTTSPDLATAAARYPGQWVMLPTIPAGHTGAPRSPRTIGTGPMPSMPSAARAHFLPVANSRRRLSTALLIAASSSGKRYSSDESLKASA